MMKNKTGLSDDSNLTEVKGKRNDKQPNSSHVLSTRSKITLIACFFEELLFGGMITGWNVFVYVLKDDGVYADACDIKDTNTTSAWDMQDGMLGSFMSFMSSYGSLRIDFSLNGTDPDITRCVAQDGHMSLAYSIAVAVMGVAAFPLGILFDRFGLRVTRLLISVLSISMLCLLGFAGGDLSWFIYPGATLMSVMNGAMMITSYHVSNLLGNKASTCISVYNGATTASGSMMLMIKLAADAGYGRRYSLVFLLCLQVVYFLNTIFLLPRYKVESPLYPITKKTKVVNVNIAPDMTDDAIVVEESGRKTSNDLQIDEAKTGQEPVSFKSSILSLLFISHVFWFAITHLRVHYFVGSFNPWVTSIVKGDLEKVSFYSNIYGATIVSALIISPAVGVLMDYMRRFINARKLKGKEQTIASLPPIIIGLILSLLLSICTLLQSEGAIVGAIALVMLFRGVAYPVMSAFLQIGFPPAHFGKLFGLVFMAGGLSNLLQYAFFAWATSVDSYTPPAILVLVLVCLSSIHAINIYVHYLIAMNKKRQKAEQSEDHLPASTHSDNDQHHMTQYTNEGFDNEMEVTRL